MIDPKANLETDSFFLIQIKESHFKEIYAVANNPVIWKQHPEKNRWKEVIASEIANQVNDPMFARYNFSFLNSVHNSAIKTRA